MNEIKCPNCGEVFTVNESQYAELLSQVRTAEFDKELHDRMRQELALAEQKAMNEQQTKLAQKDQEIAQLQSQIENFDTEKELDKDRREKNCEYAVLVTMLEADNDYFNTGIVDVSHEYEKMYVVRPQFFIQLIGLLRNAALNSLKYKQELALVREQNIDITHFEEDLDAFKLAFAKNYNSASTNFGKAIDEIDKAIKRMEEVKKFLTTSENQLRLANNKLEDVSVKKLTRKNPTMKAKFEALKGE
ncbi:Serine/threonine-protein kinase MRCK beta [Streptococcus pneumoniae]|nr:Serine/threonine-protein kinase MRCK beta [Streptococcus pneumoniae]